jgi:hypothetical protein
MKETLLQFIWQHQYFNARGLQTNAGEGLQIISPGELNIHQGPDFLGARIKLGDTIWVGTVELHVAASDWKKHAHQADKNYRNVILHVVWIDDVGTSSRKDQSDLPTLVLEHRVPKWILGQYGEWMKSRGFVACQQRMGEVSDERWNGWKDWLLEARLHRKAASVAARLGSNHQHWEETCWWMMARAFGGPVNGAAFEVIARSLPLSLLARQGSVVGLEALLLGQAGLLEQPFVDDYPRALQQEFRYLRAKYGLSILPATVHFLRMRPGNFPTIRLAQLARLLEGTSSWFSRAKEATEPSALRSLMEVAASGYWDDHYIPDRPSVHRVKRLGEELQDSLLINVFAPLLYAFGTGRDEPALRAKALRWLRSLDPEKNSIIRKWTGLGVGCRHAGDSQALLELKEHYCTPKHCLQCAIGKALLGPYPS